MRWHLGRFCDTLCWLKCPWHHPIPPLERLQLGPISKWKRYRRFPWKLVMHLVTVVALTIHAVRYSDIHGTSSQPLSSDFATIFYPADYLQYTGDATDFPYGVYRLFTIDDTVDSIEVMVERYFNLPNIAVSLVQVPSFNGTARLFPGLRPSQFTAVSFAEGLGVFEPGIAFAPTTKTSSQPILNSSWVLPHAEAGMTMSEYLTTMRQLRFDWTIKLYDPEPDPTIFDAHACFVWVVTVVYDFESRGSITVTSSQRELDPCRAVPAPPVPQGLLAVTLAASFIHMLLSIRYLVQLFRLAPRLAHARAHLEAEAALRDAPPQPANSLQHHRHAQTSVTWRTLSCHQKAALIDIWRLTAMVADAATIVFCVTEYSTQGQVYLVYTHVPATLLGAAAGLSWISMLQYLEYDRRYYILILTIKKAAPRVFKVLLGVVPLIFAYGMFGLAVFGYYAPRFGSFEVTYITLFSFMNGDAMLESFTGLSQYTDSYMLRIIGTLYLVSFMCLFAYVFLMALIAINEEAFFASREDGINVHDGRRLPIMLRALLQNITRDTVTQSTRVRESRAASAAGTTEGTDPAFGDHHKLHQHLGIGESGLSRQRAHPDERYAPPDVRFGSAAYGATGVGASSRVE